jgi:peroxiredoxin
MRYLILILTFVVLSACQLKADDTNANANIDKQYRSRVDELLKIKNSGSPDAMDKFVMGARLLIKDFPDGPNGYQDIMWAIDDYEFLGKLDQARSLAKEMMDGSAPQKYKRWAKGVFYRLDSMGKPVTMKFIAVDGRDVDLAAMKGKVVLVDFWGTHCGPCVAELPRVKVALEKFHTKGFEVIGISCDTDKKELENYVEHNSISWPQYFDGKQQSDNKFTIEFGVDGIPHMFLVDRHGCLRFDNVRAKDGFEKQITKLLEEQ